jgi:hypothetical protein
MRIVATEERPFVSGRLPAEIWEITAEEWHARQRRGIVRHGGAGDEGEGV